MDPIDWRARLRSFLLVFDPTLMTIMVLICFISAVNMYSAGHDFPGRFEQHMRNMGIAFFVMFLVACINPGLMMRLAVPVFIIGLSLLVAVAVFGDVSKGARRWLNIGFTRIQPSEIMKIAMPLMLAWYFQRREGAYYWLDFLIAAFLLVIPTLLIARQPDLGTAILVTAAGAYVIFLAGLRWRVIIGLLLLAVASLPLMWSVIHDYQKQRVLMLLDPTSDPLGKGFHIIQSTIAVGSGGITGKGFMLGTQTHLEFIPERTTDFIFAVFAEEFGLMGGCILILLYLAFISRGFVISGLGGTVFQRLLAGAIALIFFTYVFVNMGMVTGILPVVGVPLPMMSYGGTAMVTLGVGAGILMSINRNRKLMQS